MTVYWFRDPESRTFGNINARSIRGMMDGVKWFVYVDMIGSEPTEDASMEPLNKRHALFDVIGERLCRNFGPTIAVLVKDEAEGLEVAQKVRDAGFVVKTVDHTIPVGDPLWGRQTKGPVNY